MKKIVLLVFMTIGICTIGNSQESKSEDQHYRLLAIKFKHSKADEGTQQGMALFNKSRVMTGFTPLVFRSESGPYDLMVFDPVNKNNPFHDDNWEAQYKAMVEIMGSEEALTKELESFSNLVDHQETFYYKHIKDGKPD